MIWRSLSYIFANSTMLKIGTSIDRWLSIYLRPTHELDLIFTKMKPDMIFNCSHIHGTSADLPMRVARHLKIPTSVFFFHGITYHPEAAFSPNMTITLYGQGTYLTTF